SFFLSSTSRHTSSKRDWSSDVCSSDLLPELLERLGVKHVEKLYCEPTGNFAHNPEPLEKNLGDIMNLMKGGKADVAFVVDPDVEIGRASCRERVERRVGAVEEDK